ncbi:MAG: GAF domain-containing protein [Gemmatimonadaceae bacterium]|nr:GAF domain-containing protein [Gemmatimonadaceae bacterium]
MKPLVIVPAGRAIPVLDALDVEVVRVAQLPLAASLDAARPTLVLLDAALASASGGGRAAVEGLAAVAAIVGMGDTGLEEPPEALVPGVLTSFVPAGASAGAVRTVIRGGLRHAASLAAARLAAAREERSAGDIRELAKIGVALSTERDLMTLLEAILTQARRLSSADAGSLYLVDRVARGEEGAEGQLRFKLAHNDTLPNLPFRESVIAIDRHSIAGYVASTGEPLIIPDVYLLDTSVPFSFNRRFDEQVGYRTKSMLVLPMRSHKDEVIGVVQLINRKRSADALLGSPGAVESEVLDFDAHSVNLVSALASQAAVAIENARLYEDIERLFEGFVMASVTAIEARDPTTSGHSLRVATLTCGLAEAVDRSGGTGAYRGLRFTREQLRELRYAGLLHDFGKVGVREQVLVKQKKLYPSDLAIIKHRFHYLLQRADLEYERERAEYLVNFSADQYQRVLADLDARRQAKRLELQRYLDAIVQANEPTILPEGRFDELEAINARTFLDFDGVERPLLSEDELRYLMINKGNLDQRERREIESHVTHTFRFLEHIPWTGELRRIPEIAYGHHEKLNATGYPRHVGGESIPVQTRMMTISDIYDALTATDRPYKRAVPPERALDILKDEADEGALDGELLGTFIEARVFATVSPTTGRQDSRQRL